MARNVKLDSRGIAALLKSAPIDAATKAAAEAVAENVRGMGIKVGDKDGGAHEYELPVRVFPHTTDRSHVVVALAHPSGEAVQAKHGALTKAAAQAGLDVRGK